MSRLMSKYFSRKHLAPYAFIAAVVSLLVIIMDSRTIPGKGTWNQLELRSIDARFLFKKNPAKDQIKNKIAIIAIDEKSYRKINEPIIFYHTYISDVINYLAEGGVKTIGLDIELPTISLEDRIEGGYDSIYMRSLLNARRKGVNVIIGYSSPDNEPLQGYMVAAGEANLATFYLTEDADDYIRRQHLYFDDRERKHDSLSYLLAKDFTNQNLHASQQTVLIDYSLAQGVPVYSFYDVHQLSKNNNAVEENPFKGKAVLIGSSLSYEDKHSTPLSFFTHTMTDGVLIQATTLATLLTGSIFTEPGTISGSLFIIGITIITTLLCYRRRPVPAALLCLLEICLLFTISIIAFNNLYVIRVVPLSSALVFSFAGTTVFHYYVEERKKTRIRARFACYVPDQMVEQMIDQDIDKLTEGEQRKLALLFSDIRGFTSFSEANKDNPKKVVNFLNHYHTEMTEIIVGCQGTVAQLTGDGIFAFFGAPHKHNEPVLAAIRAALLMRDRIVSLKEEWSRYGIENLCAGFGIHFGDVIVGNIGSSKKMDYVAIGDNTNVASRLEGLTKTFGETIIISSTVYEQVRERIVARQLGPASIKGHSEVIVYAVDRLTDEFPSIHGTKDITGEYNTNTLT
jgi:adenylate cyclase